MLLNMTCRTKSRWYGSLLLLAQKILPFSKELRLHFFSISIQEFLSISALFFWDLETWNGQISSLRNTYKKKNNGSPSINYFIFTLKKLLHFHSQKTTSFSFMNFIVIEIHVLPRQNFELISSCQIGSRGSTKRCRRRWYVFVLKKIWT